ncbi:hypothetical protein CBR_g8730 [Chara braunii]|uniref:Uncharacterized protein n=1 Tax=Chara braunii TaxID=69332 RepID=A0A388KMT3_CHABU|nr:hypothetical protein CBR_g8730 [Chara braunii]|eukprot:GBG71308.1 hypothetical protein CBR_g8730 [Chara braunii]
MRATGKWIDSAEEGKGGGGGGGGEGGGGKAEERMESRWEAEIVLGQLAFSDGDEKREGGDYNFPPQVRVPSPAQEGQGGGGRRRGKEEEGGVARSRRRRGKEEDGGGDGRGCRIDMAAVISSKQPIFLVQNQQGSRELQFSSSSVSFSSSSSSSLLPSSLLIAVEVQSLPGTSGRALSIFAPGSSGRALSVSSSSSSSSSSSMSTSISSFNGYGGPCAVSGSCLSGGPFYSSQRVTLRLAHRTNAVARPGPFHPLHPSRCHGTSSVRSSRHKRASSRGDKLARIGYGGCRLPSSSSGDAGARLRFSLVTRASSEDEASQQQQFKGFGSPPKPKSPTSSRTGGASGGDDSRKKSRGSDGDSGDDNFSMFGSEGDDDSIPEVVSNRMMSRLAVTVGVPMMIGFAFFPFFYYLKTVQKIDIPSWLPFVTSGFIFSTAGLGITYGILSTSWDPYQEGSRLGDAEKQFNDSQFRAPLRKLVQIQAFDPTLFASGTTPLEESERETDLPASVIYHRGSGSFHWCCTAESCWLSAMATAFIPHSSIVRAFALISEEHSSLPPLRDGAVNLAAPLLRSTTPTPTPKPVMVCGTTACRPRSSRLLNTTCRFKVRGSRGSVDLLRSVDGGWETACPPHCRAGAGARRLAQQCEESVRTTAATRTTTAKATMDLSQTVTADGVLTSDSESSSALRESGVTSTSASASASDGTDRSTTAAGGGCPGCGAAEISRGCDGEGRIQGGIANIPGFRWWPIKVYRPCSNWELSGKRYRRKGQSLDEVAYGLSKSEIQKDK